MANLSESKPSPKKGFFDKLPRLSTAVWLIIIGGIFIVVMFPLGMNFVGETSQQYVLRTRLGQLQVQYDDLKSKISAQTTLVNEINQYKKEVQALKANYPKISDNPEISQAMVNVAWDNDITITSLTVGREVNKVAGTELPVLTYTAALSGQVANFQNLLIAVGKKYPASWITSVIINPAQAEGELDKATVIIQIYCNKDS